MPLGEPVEAPWGFVTLCSRSPVDCVNEDTPQARARAALTARAIAAERWRRAMDQAGHRQAPGAPALAAPAAARSGRVVLDGAKLALLRRVNAHVNAAIIPARDEQVYGVRDWWATPLSSGGRPYGDCKDYALEKRHELIALGFPASALSIALARTRTGELHAVLLVATDRGDLVLDNLTSDIRRWDATGYRWQARQSPADPMVWLGIRR